MSDYFEWNADALSVDVDEMDRQHQRLIALMNQLHEEHGAGADKATLGKTLEALGAYTVQHFAEEEQYMESIQYPALGSHKLIHADLLEKFGEHRAAFEASGEMGEEFFLFLKRWLKAHICGIDRKYGAHSQARKSA